jgi:hypothetical protein
MSAIRGAARYVLQSIVRLAPPASRTWGEAMLREMDCADGDWAALSWALGSMVAVCRSSLIEHLRHRRERVAHERLSRKPGRWVVSVIAGVAAALAVLALSVLALATIQHESWLDPGQTKIARLVFAVVIPDAICLIGAVALWRSQRRHPSGILAACAAVGAHSILYFVA